MKLGEKPCILRDLPLNSDKSKMSKLVVYKSNKIVEAAYKLTLNEQKLILSCIAKHDSVKSLQITDKFTVTANEFAELTGVELNNAYGMLKEVADNLFERYVVIDNPDPDNPKLKRTKTRWVSSIDYLPELGTVELYFAARMLPYLGQLKSQFTKYELEYIGGMKSKYGIRIYELLVQYRNFGRRDIALDWLREHLEVEDKYKIISDLKKYVIDAAVTDINKNSDLNVHDPIYQKSGRKVTSVVFDFKEKPKVVPKVKTLKSSKRPTESKPVNNFEHYADMIRRFGKEGEFVKTIPPEIVVALKEHGIL